MNDDNRSESLTIAMMRAFVTLGNNLNLSLTCDVLSVTRQTIRRHINDLEALLGQELFTVENRQYKLTEFGEGALDEAESLLYQLMSWSGDSQISRKAVNGLECSKYLDSAQREFYSQQHPVSKIAHEGLPIMKSALSAWGEASTQIEDAAMASIRKYLVVYRKTKAGWICTEIGSDSAYAKWFGWVWSKSAIGKISEADHAGDDFNNFFSHAYTRIFNEGGVRLDHLYAHLPRDDSNDLIPVSFQRLLMGCSFPDQTPALAVLVLMTNKVDVSVFNKNLECDVSEDLLMEHNP